MLDPNSNEVMLQSTLGAGATKDMLIKADYDYRKQLMQKPPAAAST